MLLKSTVCMQDEQVSELNTTHSKKNKKKKRYILM